MSQEFVTTTSQDVPGGKLYTTLFRPPGGAPGSVASAFASVSAGALQRYIPLLSAKSVAGVGLTATPTGEVPGILRTTGTTLKLIGVATNGDAKTSKTALQFVIPDNYEAGADIPITINTKVVVGEGVLDDQGTTITVNAYTETNGVEASISVVDDTALIDPAGADMVAIIEGTGLVPGQVITLELEMLVTTTEGASTGYINSVSFTA